MTIFIGGAWPYANGSLHVGHIASLLPGDILARYFRQKGERVLYVSGTDCHGTPITISAQKEGVTPNDIANKYHEEFEESFRQLGFSYDYYTRTDDEHHHREVQNIFTELHEAGYLQVKEVKQTYCSDCENFLPDRYVEGRCPVCKSYARGDQCDACSTILDSVDLEEKRCKQCGGEPIIKDAEQFYFLLSHFQEGIESFLRKNGRHWRRNAVQLTKRYLEEGLVDRAATRDMEWGISVPIEGYHDKKIYVWIEAVVGYLSASKKWSEATGAGWKPFWEGDVKAYYVHGKDNIPFHTIIWPAILLGLKRPLLPTHILSSEYLTIEKKKISTSQNWAVWIPDLLENYHPDSIRYFLCSNAPDKGDANFSWREFIYSHNSELLGAFGNFVNRTLKFVDKFFAGKLEPAVVEERFITKGQYVYSQAGELLEKGETKQALEVIFQYVRAGNKYFDEERPWVSIKENEQNCIQTLWTCVEWIQNLGNLLAPFLPTACKQLREQLQFSPEPNWSYESLASCELSTVYPLFERIDVDRICIEQEKLQQR
ncbi:methionine--tRNA ligase [Bacillus sp. 2205SS5-2]|uniref:methionine--tRNA ligase n=1 Tax=Bacillus sp. 2205SS5-2 TaxID=3109031 RepID=UPI00300502F2